MRDTYAETKLSILQAGRRLIAQKGFTATTIDQVAHDVGMTKQGVLHHFHSRDVLLTAVLAHRDQFDRDRFTPGDDLVASIIETVRYNATVPGVVALHSVLAARGAAFPESEPSRDFVNTRYPILVTELTESIERHQASGEVPADRNAASLARILIAASDGLQTQWLIDDTVDMAGELEVLWELMCS